MQPAAANTIRLFFMLVYSLVVKTRVRSRPAPKKAPDLPVGGEVDRAPAKAASGIAAKPSLAGPHRLADRTCA
jgi:hypothetical protein